MIANPNSSDNKSLHLAFNWGSELWVDFADAPTPIKKRRHMATA